MTPRKVCGLLGKPTRYGARGRHSSWLEPIMTGTLFHDPAAIACRGSTGRTRPLTFGPVGYGAGVGTVPAADFASSAVAGFARRQAAAVAALVQPSASANFVPAASASGSVLARQLPLSMIARAKSPFAVGEASCAQTEMAPEDWPSMVTLPGSPPKAPMLRCTQRRAAC